MQHMRFGFIVIGLFLGASALRADVTIDAKEPKMDHPTFKCLGVVWTLEDKDQKAKIAVEYQKVGKEDQKADEKKWKKGLDLFRVESAALPKTTHIPQGTTLFAGSIFDLEEATSYKIKLTLTGIGAKPAEKILEGRTRAEPKPYKGDRVLHVAPGSSGGTGTKDDPYKGLDAAQMVAQAGDVFLVHKGVYSGMFTITKSGTQDYPITWRGAGDGDAVIDGNNGEKALDASKAAFVRFENLHFKNAVFNAVLHRSNGCVLQKCKIIGGDRVYYALTAGQNARDLCLMDNVFEGPLSWPRSNYPGNKFKGKGDVTDMRAVVLSGIGHVVCHNHFINFGDAIDTGRGSDECSCIDFYNNENHNMVDDGVELDFSVRNVRCFNNRMTNVHDGISTQPVQGGPVYIFRNCIYNIEYTPFKMHNGPSGVLAFHNTSVKQGMPYVLYSKPPVKNSVWRNNLFVGTASNYAFESSTQMINCDFDYDGFAGGPFKMFFKWNNVRYPTPDELRQNGSAEKNCVVVNADTCFASKVEVPRDHKKTYGIEANDLRLGDKSDAIDKGAVLNNINDGFKGKAPDLGALEEGAELPHYGPRKQESSAKP